MKTLIAALALISTGVIIAAEPDYKALYEAEVQTTRATMHQLLEVTDELRAAREKLNYYCRSN